MHYNELLLTISEEYKKILCDNLVGIYVHGSIAFQCFNWDKSDIDFIVVVKQVPTQDQKIDLIKVLLELHPFAPPKGLEMSVVLEQYCRNFVYPTPFELHYSQMHYQKYKSDLNEYCLSMNGEDGDLAAHFTVIKHVGIVLCGSDIEKVFGDVPKEAYLHSIQSDIMECKEEIVDNPVYFILNLCRVLAYVRDDLVLSKQQGGEWGKENLDSAYHPFIDDAIHSYCTDVDMKLDTEVAECFCDYMLDSIFKL